MPISLFVGTIVILSGFLALYPISPLLEVDFIQYFTAAELLSRGENPYVPNTLLVEQALLRPGITEPTMMWNPPWLTTLFAPILALPYQWSIFAWLGLSVIAYLVSIALCCRIFGLSPTSGLLAAIFFPAIVTFAFGQVSIILLLGALLFIRGVQSSRPLPIAAGAVLMSLKPHLFLLLGLAFFNYLIHLRAAQRRPLILGLLLATTTGLLWCLFNATALGFWIAALTGPVEGAVAPKQWIVATLPGILRVALGQFEMVGGNTWPSAMIPAITLLVFQLAVMLRGKPFDVSIHGAWILALSYLTSPYGWVFDGVLLLPLYLLLFAIPARNSTARSVSLVIASFAAFVNVAAYALLFVPNLRLSQHSFWWLPCVLLILWLYREHIVRRSQQGVQP